MKQTLLQYGCRLSAALAVILLTSGCWFSPDIPKEAAQQSRKSTATTAGQQAPAAEDSPAAIIFEEPEAPQTEVDSAGSDKEKNIAPAPAADNRPRVAIIIDDMGYHRKIGDRLLGLKLNLSFSFLPHAPYAGEQEEAAYQKGRDILIHLPMEASDSKWDPGPGALYLSASPAELVNTLKKNLEAVPHATGANNHMGSKFTENRPAMHTVLQELKHQGLFFVDSFTTAQSTGMDEAGKMGIKTNRRHIFLDNEQDLKKICGQLDKLASVAIRKNGAIGIGHPYQATLDALRKCGGRLLETVQVVPVHTLVE